MNRSQCEKFIRQNLLRAINPIVEFRLVHLVSGDVRGCSIVLSSPIDKESGTDHAVASIVDSIEESVSEDVKSYSRLQAYAVLAMSESDQQIAMYRFKLAPGPDSQLAVEESEPPTERGALAMIMRHADASARLSQQAIVQSNIAINQSNTALREENDALRERIRELEREHVHTIQLREELESKQHERDIELLEVSAKQARLDRSVKLLEQIAPFAAVKLLGTKKPGAPNKPADDTESKSDPTVDLFESLKPEQYGPILELLDESQREKLAAVIDAVESKQAAIKGNGQSH